VRAHVESDDRRVAAMLLDIVYLVIGSGALLACWQFVKACDRL
jgi:hypothetical protein